MADAAHGLMAAGMVVMVALPGIPRVWQQGAFCALALWLASAGLGHVREDAGRQAALPGSHHLHHVIGSLAIAYMVAGPPAPADQPAGGMAGMPAAAGAAVLQAPAVGWLLLAYFAGYAAWSGTGLARLSAAGSAARPGAPASVIRLVALPELKCACQMVMGIAMACMLLSML
jgi:hypothetical protein